MNTPTNPPKGVELGANKHTLGLGAQLGAAVSKVGNIVSAQNHIEDIQGGDYIYLNRNNNTTSIVQVRTLSQLTGTPGKYIVEGILENGEKIERVCFDEEVQKIPQIGDFITTQITGSLKQLVVSQHNENFKILIGEFGEDSMEVPRNSIKPLPVLQIGDDILITRGNKSQTRASVEAINYSTGKLTAFWGESGREARKTTDIGLVIPVKI